MLIYITNNGERLGPFEESEVKEGLRSGRFTGEELGIFSGQAEWKTLAELFPRGVNRLAAPASPSRGGCLKTLGTLMMVFGILMFLGAALVAGGSMIMPDPLMCEIADARKADADKALKAYETAKGTPGEDATKRELEYATGALKAASSACGDSLSTKRLITYGGVAVLLVGFLMTLVGFFVRRVTAG